MRIEAIADGNPRLLMALDRVLVSGLVDESAVLTKLESTREAFRSDVLAELLLGMVSGAEKAVLVKSLVFRLAMAAKDGEIAGIMANAVSQKLSETSDYPRILTLCRSTIVISNNLGMMTELAIAEDASGNPQKALELHQQVLELCTEEDAQLKALTLNQMAIIYANQGQVERAIDLYQRSLAIKEQIWDIQGKSQTLNQIAGIYANQGLIQEAIDLFQQSLAINTQIGYAQGKAVTLWWFGKLLTDDDRDVAKGLVYLKEAREIFLHLKSPSAQVVQEIIERIER